MSSKVGSRPVGRPPGADADRTKAAILEHALLAFAERGFDGASIREITGAAGVGHNLVRHYFGSKDDLWTATVHSALDPAATRIAEILRAGIDGPVEDALRAGVEVLFDEVGSNPPAVRLLVTEAIRGGPRFDRIYDEILAPLGEVFLTFSARTSSDLAPVDPRSLTLYVFAAVHGASALDGLGGRLGLADPDGGLRQRAVDDLLELVLYGLLGKR